MKSKILVVTLLVFSSCVWGQKPMFHVRYSEPLAVFVFVKNLTKNYGENPFKIEFKKSAYNEKKYQDLVTQLDTLQIDYSFQYTEFPYGSKIPGMTEAMLKKNLIVSDNIVDFKVRSVGVIPNTKLNKLAEILTEFTPIYKELIFKPNQAKFESQLAAISNFIQTKSTNDYFETGLKFYNCAWDTQIPFEIVFYPLPNSQGFTAEAFYNNAVSAIQTDLKDYNILLSVMLHEIYHILYDEQSLAVKQELETFFSQHPSKVSRYAYLLLNEVLATALGNGYVFEDLSKKADPGEWYHWSYINLMAKQIYPTVLEYVKLKKSIDKQFVDTYISLYEKNYPDWINEPEHTMTYRYVLSTNYSDFDVFAQVYPYCSMSEMDDQINEASLVKARSTPLTKVIIVSKDHREQLALVRKAFPELMQWKYQPDQEFVHQVFLNDKTKLYVINQFKTPTETLIKNLSKTNW